MDTVHHAAPAPPIRLATWIRHPVTTVLSAWRAIHDSREPAALRGPVDARVIGGLLLATVVLAVNSVMFGRENVRRFFMHVAIVPFPFKELAADGGWAFARFVTLGVVPMVYARAIGLPLRALGLQSPDTRAEARTAGALFAGLAPFLLIAATTPQFQQKYPLYALAGRSALDFVGWEILYALQFFGIELFYRGFLLELLRPACGVYAIFVATIPYCMVHFGKPPLEVFASIAAGLILGTLAIRRRSVFPGLALHLLAAIGMDTLAILLKR